MAKRTDQISWQDAEDLQLFVEELQGLTITANPMDPKGSPTYEVPSCPSGFDSFLSSSKSALARSVYRRLVAATWLYSPTSTVLVALHSPPAVACDGKRALTPEELEKCRNDRTYRASKQLDVGRLLGVYPCTWTAAEARLWRTTREDRIAVERMARGLLRVSGGNERRGRKKTQPLDRAAEYLSLDGRRPTEILSAIANRKGQAKGVEAEMWREIDREARVLVEASARAWNAMPSHRKREREIFRTGFVRESAA